MHHSAGAQHEIALNLYSKLRLSHDHSNYRSLINVIFYDDSYISLPHQEYDDRFAKFGDAFVHYDYNHPTALPESLLETNADFVIADPPFLSLECVTKVASTIRALKPNYTLYCTGAIMAESLQSILGLHECAFRPEHSHNLSNDFRSFASYPSELGII